MLVKSELLPANIATSSRTLRQRLFFLLQNCTTLDKLAQIHTQILTNRFSQKSFLLVKLLSFYISSGQLLSARRVFKNVESPSTTLWNQMIRGYSRSENPKECVELFEQMAAVGEAEPNGYTYSFVLSGCAKAGLLGVGQQVHGRVVANGCSSNVFVRTSLVNLYAVAGGGSGIRLARQVFDDMGEKSVVSWNSMLAGYMRCGDVDEARRIFYEMPERNVVSWTTLIAGCTQNGRCKEALRLFKQMRRARMELDQVVLVASLSACAELGDLELGRWIHAYVEKTYGGRSQQLLVTLNNALIHMYASCGAIKQAYEVFRWMPRRSTVSWTSLITALAKQGYAQEALVVFQWMQIVGEKDIKPDNVTFLGVLSACSHAGFVHEGLRFFKNMIENWGIEPRIEHYGCMVDLLCRAGFLGEAKNLIETMPVKPNDAVWGALLGGCRIHKNAEVAFHVAQKLVAELDREKATGYLVLLAQVYMTAERWYDVANVRKIITEMGMPKPAGRSWVKLNGAVHDFVAGDRTHKNASLIYELLGMLIYQSKDEGDVPDAPSVDWSQI